MRSLSGFLTTFILLGAVQGFIAAALLFFSGLNRRTSRFLAWIILLVALACLNLYSNQKDWYGSDLLRFLGVVIPTVVIMPVGPLIWFYVQSSLDPHFVITRKRRRHFWPVIIDLVPCLTPWVLIVGIVAGAFKNNTGAWGIFIDDWNMYADIPRWISISTYSYLSYRLLLNAKSEIKTRWLKQFLWVFFIFQAVWLIFLIPYIIPKYTNKLLGAVDWYPVYLPLVAMIYFLGIKGYMISLQTGFTKKANGVGSSLTDSTVSETVGRLMKSMVEEKLYLNPALNLQILSQHTGLQQKLVSAVLNQHIHKSFNAFVNEYRVEAFKKKVMEEDMENLTMAGIAAECGFNSQATFQRTFKEITGMSPSEFRRSVA